MSARWYRAYEGTVTDAKLGEVALVAGCSRSVAIAAWHSILESAATANDGGKFDVTPRRVAVILCEPPAIVEAVFSELEALGMICAGCVVAWKNISGIMRPSASVWAGIRSRIFMRDDFTCAYCGRRGGKLECDHIIPVSRGGWHGDNNLVTACFSCNRAKRDRTPQEMGWRR